MLRSMTGFGRSEKHENSVSYKVEARSVNSRFIEINTRIPKTLALLEQPIKKLIKKYCSRGSFDITITLEKNNGSTLEQEVKPNIPLVSQYVDALNQIKNQFKLSGEIDINSILPLRDVIKYEPLEMNIPANDMILKTVEEALAFDDGTLVAFDSNSGLYTFRFDASNPAPAPEPWAIDPVTA